MLRAPLLTAPTAPVALMVRAPLLTVLTVLTVLVALVVRLGCWVSLGAMRSWWLLPGGASGRGCGGGW